MSETHPDLDVASVEELRDYARKVQELMDTRVLVVEALYDRHGKTWPEIATITGWPLSNVYRWYHQKNPKGAK